MGDIFDDENEPTLTMKEYVEGLEAQELEADLVLGGDEGKECTYSKGYMKRQAVFSCLTCVPAGNAGVCTACSLTCHDGHEANSFPFLLEEFPHCQLRRGLVDCPELQVLVPACQWKIAALHQALSLFSLTSSA